MRKILIIAVAVLFVSSSNIYAQGKLLKKDPKAEKILNALSKKTKSYKTLRVKFSYTIENLRDKSKNDYKGYAFIAGKKYKLITPGQVIFSDGTTVWSHLKEANEMTISEPDEDEDSILNPSRLFTIYEKGFKFQYIGKEKTKEGKLFDVIDLFPENPDKKKYSRIRLRILPKQMQLSSIHSFGTDGVHVIVNIIEYKPNIKVSDKLFSFDKSKYPKDLEVVDIR